MAKFNIYSNKLSKLLVGSYPLSLRDDLGGFFDVVEGKWRKIHVKYSIPSGALSDDGQFGISGEMKLLIPNRFSWQASFENLEIRLIQYGGNLNSNEFYQTGNLSDVVLKYFYENHIPLEKNPDSLHWKPDSTKHPEYESNWTFKPISQYFLILSDLFNIFQLYSPQASGETLLEEIKGKISGLLLQIYNNEESFNVDIDNVVVTESSIHAFKIAVPVVVDEDCKIRFIKSLKGDPYMEVTLPRLKRYDFNHKTKFEINPNYAVSVKK